MSVRTNPNIAMFFGIAYLLVAWRIAPDQGDDWRLWGLTGLFALGGLEGVMHGIQLTSRARGPRPPRRTPPKWLTAWVIVVGLAVGFGTPHLRIVYGPNGCHYAGWNGWERHGVYPCPLIALLPLRIDEVRAETQ